MFGCFRSTSEAFDISGFGTIPETPRRPPTAAPASLHVLRRPPLDGEYISVTDSSGSRVYLRQKEDTGTKVSSSSSVMLKPCFIHSVQTSSVTCLFLLHICNSLHYPVCMSVCVSLSLSLSPGSGVQICAKLSWWAGSSGLAHRCAERTRGREGE